MFIECTNKEILTIDPSVINVNTSYPDGDGVYLVHDGVAYLVSVVIGGAVSTLILPTNFVPLEQRSEGKTIINRLDTIEKSIQNKSVEHQLKEVIKHLTTLDIKTTQSSSNFNLAEITNLVAVSQDASLIKNI